MEPKKSPAADLERKRGLFFQIGLVFSLLITYVTFEWKNKNGNYLISEREISSDIPEEIIPITRQEDKPLPPPVFQQLLIVENNIEIKNEVQVQETEITEESVVEVEQVSEEVYEEPEIFMTAEQMPEFPEGDAKMFTYLASNIKYPGIALENGISGTVFLSFVVGADGYVKNVKVLKGIGGGCDEEAVRVVSAMPKWNPGRQRNKPVPVQFSIPVQFRLQ